MSAATPSSQSQAPIGTRHIKRKFTSKLTAVAEKTSRIAKDTATRLAQLRTLPDLIKTHFKSWKDGARPFQLECMEAQVLGKDVFLHAATGSGKTGIAAGPHLLPCNNGKVTLFVSPLLSLHAEQEITFRTEFGLKTAVVNSTYGHNSQQLLDEIVTGQYQIVILSPEMLQSRRFVERVLCKTEFSMRCLSVFVDEAHCVSHWGAEFRKKYGTLGIVRSFLPSGTSMVAVSATFTPHVRRDVLQKLQFGTDFVDVNIGNDRPTVAQVVRAMEHPMNTFHDIDFLIPQDMQHPEDIAKGFVYYDDVAGGNSITSHLNGLVKQEFRHLGLVQPYNAAMSQEYRDEVMALFKAGIIRILVCTDVAGMGCNIPDIDIVVQWKTPTHLSSWVQRAGRVARGPGRSGLAVMLVEKSAFEVDPSAPATASTHTKPYKSTKTRLTKKGGAKRDSHYAVLHGQKRGMRSGLHDAVPVAEEPTIDDDSPAEGLYAFIQTTVCRWQVLTKVFGNKPPIVLQEQCCDLCNPSLFIHVRAGQAPPARRQTNIKKGLADDSIRAALYSWRHLMKAQHYPNAIWAPHAFLDNNTCELLSSVGPIGSKIRLERMIGSTWGFWNQHGEALLVYLQSLDVSAMRVAAPVVPPKTATKRRVLDNTAPHTPDLELAAKRVKWTVPTTPFTVQQSHLVTTPAAIAMSSSLQFPRTSPGICTTTIPVEQQRWQFTTPTQSHSFSQPAAHPSTPVYHTHPSVTQQPHPPQPATSTLSRHMQSLPYYTSFSLPAGSSSITRPFRTRPPRASSALSPDYEPPYCTLSEQALN